MVYVDNLLDLAKQTPNLTQLEHLCEVLSYSGG